MYSLQTLLLNTNWVKITYFLKWVKIDCTEGHAIVHVRGPNRWLVVRKITEPVEILNTKHQTGSQTFMFLQKAIVQQPEKSTLLNKNPVSHFKCFLLLREVV